jgi:hypothetical protein
MGMELSAASRPLLVVDRNALHRRNRQSVTRFFSTKILTLTLVETLRYTSSVTGR